MAEQKIYTLKELEEKVERFENGDLQNLKNTAPYFCYRNYRDLMRRRGLIEIGEKYKR